MDHSMNVSVEHISDYSHLPYAIGSSRPEPTPIQVGQASLVLSTEEERQREARRRGRPSVINSVSNLQSSCPSPDEIIIKERGRRSLPVKWSPIPIESPQKTPLRPFLTRSPKKGLITLRSSPRKRLQLSDASSIDVIQGRKSLLSSSPLARKSCERETESTKEASEQSVNKLSKDQLVSVLSSIMQKHPQIKDEIGTILEMKSENEQCESPATNNNNNVASHCKSV